MLEISPVLAGTFDKPDYTPAGANFNSGGNAATDVAAVDSRRYSQFDRTASQVGDATMSFGDFLDMVNPLQHIPVVSSVYRAITGDSINPVSRIAGDVLYGAALGPVAALAGAVGGIADSVMESKTGKDVTGTVLAELFGDDQSPDSTAPAQIADAGTTAADVVTTAPVQSVAAEATTLTPAAPATDATQLAKAIPLNRNKLPYGGVMAPVRTYHEENLAMAVSKATGIRVGNTVYPNRITNGARALPPAAPAMQAATAASSGNSAVPPSPSSITALPADNATTPPLPSTPMPAGGLNGGAQTTAGNLPLPEALADDPYIMKALGVYQSVAASAAQSSTSVGF